jgi:hypothetical protein
MSWRRWEAVQGQWWRCSPCFGAEGGRRGQVGLVGQKAERAGGATRRTGPKYEEEPF